jgi:hypothetical protein
MSGRSQRSDCEASVQTRNRARRSTDGRGGAVLGTRAVAFGSPGRERCGQRSIAGQRRNWLSPTGSNSGSELIATSPTQLGWRAPVGGTLARRPELARLGGCGGRPSWRTKRERRPGAAVATMFATSACIALVTRQRPRAAPSLSAREHSISATTVSGSSIHGSWPAPGTRTRRTLKFVAASASASCLGRRCAIAATRRPVRYSR